MSISMTMKALCEKYVSEHESGLAPSTVVFYQNGVVIFERFIGRVATIEDLTRETLFKFADWLVATYPKKATASSRMRSIKALVFFAAREELIKPITKIRKIKIPSVNPTAWTDEECRTLINTALTGAFVVDGWSKLPNGPSKGLFFACLFAVSWDTSLRLGDQLDLKWSDLTIEKDGSARAVISQNKTGHLAPISIKAETVTLLKTLADAYEKRQENLFVFPYSREQFFDCVRKIVKTAGVTKGTLRFLRRGSATYAELKQPGAGKVALHHRSDWTSQTYYLDQNILAQRKLDKPNVLESGERGNPLVVVEDIPQWKKRGVPLDTADEIVAARIVHLCFEYEDKPFPAELPVAIKSKLKEYGKVALENLYEHPMTEEWYEHRKEQEGSDTTYDEYLANRIACHKQYLADNPSLSNVVKADLPDYPRFGHVVSAKIDGVLIGVAQFHDDGLIHNLSVHSDFRRKGVGTTLVKEIVRRCGRAEAYTEELSEGAQAFVESLGFENAPSDSAVLG